MSKCESCSNKDGCDGETCSKLIPKYGNIKAIIGVISGKGGVGKSTVTSILAVQLKKKGYTVGILDADITGPSIPRIFGIEEMRSKMTEASSSKEVKFIPVNTPLGIKVMSLNLLTEEEEQPVIWRGPVINGVLNQMFRDTEWGELDYLLIDMPPGTGDIALTVMQSFPVTSLVVVATPQNMVTMIVKKVVIMAEKLGMDIIGVVENMAYIKCKSCGEREQVFSSKSGEEQAKALGIPLLAELPINIEFTDKMEMGEGEAFIYQSSEYDQLGEAIISKVTI